MTTTPTSGAADLRATFSEMLVDLPNTEPFTLFKAGFDAALAAGQATAQQAAEPVALLVRKNSWRDGQWEAAPPNSPSYGLAWANQRMYVYTTPQPTQAQAAEPVARLVIGKTKGGVSLTHMVVPAAYQLQEGVYALYTAPQPVARVPMTNEHIRAMLNKHPPEDVCDWSYRMGIDDAELHHGIKGGQHEPKQMD